MYTEKLRAIGLCLVAALFLAGCQTTALVESKQPFRITHVEVTKAKPEIGTVNLPEDVRAKALQTAYRYSETGVEKTLKIELVNLHFKNPVASYLVGDNNRLTAKATVIDKASGAADAAFNAVVSNKGAINGIAGAIISAGQSISRRSNSLPRISPSGS